MEGLLAALAVVEAVAAIWGSVICCKGYCCCCSSTPTFQVSLIVTRCLASNWRRAYPHTVQCHLLSLINFNFVELAVFCLAFCSNWKMTWQVMFISEFTTRQKKIDEFL
jgi:hypothetical protein